jgi:ribonuclease Z
LTFDPKPIKTYAYCSDTAFDSSIISIIKNSDWLYHESTFLEEHSDLAKKTKHSTAKQAALIAKEAKVGRLILGHFSSRYKDLSLFEKEANSIFPNVILANDGAIIS